MNNREDAEIVEALIRRGDAMRATIRRTEWAIQACRENALAIKETAEPVEREKADAIISTLDFIEKILEG